MRKNGKLPLVYMGVVLVLTYIPILIVLFYSFNQSKTSSVWGGFSLTWYTELFKDRALFEALKNSLVLGLLSSLCAGVVGTLGAVGMQRARLRSGPAMEYLSTLPIMVPEIILGMVFLAFFSLLGLPFGMLTLVIAHTAFCIPYVYLLVKARLAGMDKSYIEAAQDLGAGEMRAFYDITLPLVWPAVLSGMLLSFAMSFDDVVISSFVTGVNTNTLPLKIYSQIKTGGTPKTNALFTILFAATILLGLLSSWIGRSHKGHKHKPKQTEEL
ncbi:MAG: ABC transporter permease [Oscillospiraceae bacterium]